VGGPPAQGQSTGFICEPYGVVGCTDITSYGGWRAFRKATGI
jgi:hypothetical protein